MVRPEKPTHDETPLGEAVWAGSGDPEGTCNCSEPGRSESDPGTCRNCGYRLQAWQFGS
jgi:hypothetical protein